MKRVVTKAIDITMIMITIIMIVWIALSFGEVYEHNSFKGYTHEYSTWNVFILIFE